MPLDSDDGPVLEDYCDNNDLIYIVVDRAEKRALLLQARSYCKSALESLVRPFKELLQVTHRGSL